MREKSPVMTSSSCGVKSRDNPRQWLLGRIALDIDDGATLVKRGAVASSCSTGNVLYFFGRQLAGAHAIQYSVRRVLFQHDLLLFSMKMIFSKQMETDYEQYQPA
jgi:hypothetical protein